MNNHPNLRRLAASLYPIHGINQLNFYFRVLKVLDPVPNDNEKPQRLQRWADYIWRSELKCPTYPTQRMGYPAFLIPDSEELATNRILKIEDVPNKVYRVKITSEKINVRLPEAFASERELICRMLERPFSDQLRSQKDKFWRSNWTTYFKLESENFNREDDLANAYRGIKFGVVYVQGQGIFFATDLKTRYVSKKSLSGYCKNDEIHDVLKKYLEEVDFNSRGWFLRDNGPLKIPCRFAGFTGSNVSDFSFTSGNREQSIYEYYSSTYPGIDIDPCEEAVFVKDRSKKESIGVPISRLFPVFTTDYQALRTCSIRPQISPDARKLITDYFLSALSNIRYGDKELNIEREIFSTSRTIIIPPRLEYGNEMLLSPFKNGVPNKASLAFDKGIKNWSKHKLEFLYKARVHNMMPLPNFVLILPDGIKRQDREDFIVKLSEEITRQSGEKPQFIKQNSYRIGNNEIRGESLLETVDEIGHQSRDALFIVVLWDGLTRHVYTELKKSVAFSQCLTEQSFRRITRTNSEYKIRKIISNLALGALTEVGIQPWVIADNLRHDLHVGIDVLEGQTVYHFLYGQGGRIVRREFGRSSSKSTDRREAIKRFEIYKEFDKALRSIFQETSHIQTMIIHRDGRWWPSEHDGLVEVIEKLKQEKILPVDFTYAVVEIRKNHLPVRLFTEIAQRENKVLSNPLPGTFLILDTTRALLTTTGTASWDSSRTAGNLLLEVVDSNSVLDILSITEDIFWLTQLNWSAPDLEIGLPVTIQWGDQALRRTFYSPAEEIE
jgi:hypothetical protein